ncbi:MAG: DUF1735 domain-containing protein [Capnocytophaga sp.]|nr:DUF1735 domain-containing protein [Capnocytophaga sp.]
MKTKYIIASVLCAFLLGCEKEKLELTQPQNNTSTFQESSFYYKEKPTEEITRLANDGEYTFVAKIGKAASESGNILLNTTEMAKIVNNYNTFKGVKDFSLLPNNYYSFEGNTYNAGDTQAEAKLTIKNFSSLAYGDYLLPLKVTMAGQEMFHLVILNKDSEYSPITETSKKPMPPATYSCNNRTEPMKMVAYVETNDWDIRNMGQFILKDSKKPVFDIVILFAPNMNYNTQTGKRTLFFNEKLQPIVNDPDKYIKPLKDRGIKVLATILPNHQGVGYFNFQNYEEAREFATECKIWADKLGLDGYDIDEEYAEYYKLPSKPRKGSQSVFWFMRAMKEVMPDKLLTLYDYDHGLQRDSVDELGKHVSDYVDYSWANYNENHGSFSDIPDERYGSFSIEANWGWSMSYADYFANHNLENCFGMLMIFNINGEHIKDGSTATNLSKATMLFYGEETIFNGKYHKGPKDN